MVKTKIEKVELVAVEQDGKLAGGRDAGPSEMARQSLPATVAHYAKVGFTPPWNGYVAFASGTAVGVCAFVSAPKGGRVEIAYGTFQGNEGRGIATAMGRALLAIATATDPSAKVIAHTLPEKNASTRVLGKLGFNLTGKISHPEDGEVWLWEKITW